MDTAETPRFTNRLAREKSPYLQQHAHNPVDWYPWGEEAFTRARREDKPIFLSIGYSTCHWCHVMEHESFENEAIAKVLNDLFVCIKVDREERPDIDQIYMDAVVALTGSGGWPMTVFLTPDLRPFYGGTYFPPEDRGGRPGLPRLAHAIADAYHTRKDEVGASADSLAGSLRSEILPSDRTTPGLETLRIGEAQFARMSDPVHGGFGPAPKFPRSHVISFLLRWWKRTGEAGTLERIETTLQEMQKGGMHDHLGGGFHRYSVDERWLVPHFEKMLYDQAILARSYLEAFRATGQAVYAETARDTFTYTLRDLTSPQGGFYSAEDADSEGIEGKFYVWTPAQLAEVLGDEPARELGRVYDVTEHGNFEHGWSILNLSGHRGEIPKDTQTRLAAARAKLLEARGRRIRPHRDEKVLTDWNGLMIGALAEGAATLDEPRYAAAAAKAADFLLMHLKANGRLLHTWRDGDAKIPAFLDDYAFLGNGLVDLYEATFDLRWLDEARSLAREMNRLFRDPQGGGWFLTGTDNEALLTRPKELYDGAVMSGNSMAALLCLRLGHLTGETDLEEVGRAALRELGAEIASKPAAYPQMLIAADFAAGPIQEIVVAGDPADPRAARLLHEVRRRFLPHAVVALRPDGAAGEAAVQRMGYLARQTAAGGVPTAYVCEAYACKLPVTEPGKLGAFLDARPSSPAGR